MPADHILSFGSYRLDLAGARLWRGKHAVKLTGKAFAVLRRLVTHAGELVTKDELLQAVWPETVVSDAALTSCIKELRQALRDQAQERRYIETVHRRGFRFIGKVASSQYSVASRRTAGSGSQLTTDNWQLTTPPPQLATGNWPLTTPLVGRELELAQLHTCFAKALNGERQIIFVTGEPGIGKTTLVEAFLMGIRGWGLGVGSASLPTTILTPPVSALIPIPNPQSPTPNPWIGRGQCIEHYGAGEAYLPILEALGRLGRAPDGNRVIEILSQHAPTWLVQMPALLGVTELEALQRKTQGATRERMLRELAEAVEALTADRLLILWLEDLHWADVSTLDWLAYVARRREPARLLVIGTYRPTDVLVQGHPLRAVKQELQTRGYCTELLLDFLTEEAIAEYLAQRFVSPSPASAGEGRGEGRSQASFRKLARLIHRRTDGNPLFMVNVINDLVARGVLGQNEGRWELKGGIEEGIGGVPESLQRLIEQQIERLRPETQRLLEVASVAGAEFSAAVVAAGLETEIDVIEEQCEALVRQKHFLRASGTAEWPDGAVAARYGFLHAMYQDVLYHQLTARRRQRLHQRIGEREEQGYSKQTREIAAELALHFERGRDYRRAVRYLWQAGEKALWRSAHVEAIHHLTKGLDLLKFLPDTLERDQSELPLQLTLGGTLMFTRGFGSIEMAQAYTRACELCRQVGETPPVLFLVLEGFSVFHVTRAEYLTAQEFAEQLLGLAQDTQDPADYTRAHQMLGTAAFWLGELTSARAHFEQALAFHGPQRSSILYDPRVTSPSFLAVILYLLGYPDQALQRSRQALTLAQDLAFPASLAYALNHAVYFHQVRREEYWVQKRAEALIALCREQGYPQQGATGAILWGWALAEHGQTEEGIAQMHQGLATRQTTGAEQGRSYFLALLAEAYGKTGQREEGLRVLAEAFDFMNKTGERFWEAELYRLYGELSLRIGEPETGRTGDKNPLPDSPFPRFSVSSPEDSFLKAIDIARKQQAKSLELRATMSLARLWQQQGKKEEAQHMLAEIYNWFTEGFDTADLKEAKVLLDELLL
jgi:DNA-binding winged helix-turn-helix (wHTH) protein/tetratricopeptide (TPR) repeat protein